MNHRVFVLSLASDFRWACDEFADEFSSVVAGSFGDCYFLGFHFDGRFFRHILVHLIMISWYA